ncbi:fibronectin type III domain-containing protein [Fulvivirga sp. 29W222]|uniref:Fibronectin type III domain-containing protein n=1 Tax=Fulvivirga marina TaxID=2494733 RepID=A0A937FZ26_9BACT|nr:fibronectin type III domain-containing protein [Fulvivirga marina]MBL6445541.1 fibronectin type III domain-containing protein [Fulvivirga marina]
MKKCNIRSYAILLLLLCYSSITAFGAATFVFNPAQPTAGQTVTVQVTDTSPWAYVDVQATGPNTVNGTWGGVVDNGNGSWTWTWTFSGLQQGSYTVKFYSNNFSELRGQTSLTVAGNGNASFAFTPSQPTAGETVTVQVTDTSPWAYVDVQATGPNTVNGTWGGVVDNGNGSWTWTWTLSGLQQGNYTVGFYSDNFAQLRGQTSLSVSAGSGTTDDAWFQFNPPNPSPGQSVQVKVTSRTGFANINLDVNRNGTNVPATYNTYIPNDDYYDGATHTWVYDLPALQNGVHSITFTADNGSTTAGQTILPVQGRSMRSITPSYFGFNGHFWWTYNCGTVGDRIQRFIDEYQALGAKTIRIGIDWAAVEPSRGSRNYSYFDDILTRFNAAGITVIGLFYTAPAWATEDGSAWGLGKKLNRNEVNAMRATAQDMAQRYPFIHNWEFWNEPHFRSVMTEGEEFAFWFRNFSQAIKGVRSSDKISFGTIITPDSGPHTASFVKNVMSALEGYQPDAISLHPYYGSSVNTTQISQIHNLVPHVPLWITEYGWNNYSEENQTNNLENAITWMQSQSYIEFAIMHMLHDWDETNDTHCDFSDDGPGNERYGLVTLPFYQGQNYHRKQAWYKFRELALGLSACTVPANPTANSITSNSANISWSLVSGASEYQVAYKPSADVSGWLYKTVTSTNTSLTGLNASTEYVYLVRANCSGNWTGWTTNSYFTTLSGCTPPSGLGANSITTSSANVYWASMSGATQYQVAYKPSADVSGWLYKTVTSTSTNLTGLNSSTQYVFVVSAYCPSSGGWTGYSSNGFFTTSGNCHPPIGLGAAASSTYAYLSWTSVANATAYYVAYKPRDYGSWQYQTTGGTTAYVSGLTPLTPYVFVVATYCPSNGWTGYSSNYTFYTSGSLLQSTPDTQARTQTTQPEPPTNDIMEMQKITMDIYPNPVEEGQWVGMTIHMTAEENVEVTLLDHTGRRIEQLMNKKLKRGINNVKFTLHSVKSGMYLVQVVQGAQQETLKLMVK